MILFAIQLMSSEKYAYVNFVSSKDRMEEVIAKIQKKKYTDNPKLIIHPDFSKDYQSDKEVRKSGQKFIDALRNEGYMLVDGGLLTGWRRLYVIHINSPDSKQVYVGQTAYPEDVRLMQHRLGIKRARVFRNNYAHSIAKELILDKKFYLMSSEAVRAEKRLAAKLEKKGYEVHCG